MHVYAVAARSGNSQPSLLLSYSAAQKLAVDLARRTRAPHDIHLHRESEDHVRLVYTVKYEMDDRMDGFIISST